MLPYFDSYEVHGVQDIGTNAAKVVPDADADYWSIYGKTNGMFTCVGDYDTRDIAEYIVDMMNKNHGLPPQ